MVGNGKKAALLVVLIPAVLLTALIALRCVSVIKIALIALVVSYLLLPAVSCLERRMPRALAILLVYAAIILLIAGLVVLVFFPMLRELSGLPEYAYRFVNTIELLSERLSSRFGAEEISKGFFTPFHDALGQGTGMLISAVFSVASGAAGFFANALISLALSWFFLIDWEKVSLRMFLCVPSGVRPKVITAIQSIRRELGGYLRAQSALILIMFVITAAVLLVTGVPMPVSMAVMYALLNAVPYFGPLVGTIPPVFAALTVSPMNALYTLGALLLIQQADNYILSPRIMGAAAGAGPAAVLIAISAGGALGGIPGMFLALPTLVAVKSVYRVFTAPNT